MGAIVLAEPGPGPRAGRSRCLVPALLLAGWAGLFAYSAAYLFEDMPFRPPAAETGLAVPGEGAPRQVLLVEAPAPPQPMPAEPPRIDPPRTDSPRIQAAREPAAPVPAAVPAATPAVPPRSAAPATEYVGVWGPTPAACGAPSRRRGYLPATITADHARAGRTSCNFHDGHRTGNAWVLAAECSDRGRRWSSQVRLVVEGDRLTWTSSRGTAAYIRCGRRAG